MSSEIADTHDRSRAVFLAVFERWSELIAQAIAQAQASGDIVRAGDPAQLARFVLNAWQGSLVRMKVVKSDEPFKDFNALVFDTLLK
jgi:TetR/AcrR family transcriptional repressor of nem operon